jgi:hypothetical protein
LVSLGSDLGEERVQTVRVTLKPLVSGAESLAKLRESDPDQAEQIAEDSVRMLKGATSPGQRMSWP